MTVPRRALVVDDDPGVADAVKYRLQRCGFFAEHITIVASALDAMLALEATRFDVVLLDQRLPDSALDMNPRDEIGRKVLRHCRRKHPSVPVIGMTAYTGTSPAEASHMTALFMKLGARDFIPKPFEEAIETLEAKILEVLSDSEAEPAGSTAPAPLPTIQRTGNRVILGIPGHEVKRRTRTTVNGKDADLSNARFILLLTLVDARLRGAPRVSIYDLGAKSGVQFRGMSALRTEMAPFLHGATLLRNDGQSSYELHDDIELGGIDCALLAQHSESRVRTLAASISRKRGEDGSSAPAATGAPPGKRSSSVRLRFLCRYDNRKCWVEADGREEFLSPTHYEMLAHLALARAGGGLGLVDREILGSKDYGWNEMTRLRKELRRLFGPAADGLIAADGKKRFRLTFAAREVDLDRTVLAAHPCGRIRDAFPAARR